MMKVTQVTDSDNIQTVREFLMIKATGAMNKGIITCKIGRWAAIKVGSPVLLLGLQPPVP